MVEKSNKYKNKVGGPKLKNDHISHFLESAKLILDFIFSDFFLLLQLDLVKRLVIFQIKDKYAAAAVVETKLTNCFSVLTTKIDERTQILIF